MVQITLITNYVWNTHKRIATVTSTILKWIYVVKVVNNQCFFLTMKVDLHLLKLWNLRIGIPILSVLLKMETHAFGFLDIICVIVRSIPVRKVRLSSLWHFHIYFSVLLCCTLVCMNHFYQWHTCLYVPIIFSLMSQFLEVFVVTLSASLIVFWVSV